MATRIQDASGDIGNRQGKRSRRAGLEAGWRIVARRGWLKGWLAARRQYNGAPEIMKERESIPLRDLTKPDDPYMSIGGNALSGDGIIVRAVYQHSAKACFAGGVEFFYHVG